MPFDVCSIILASRILISFGISIRNGSRSIKSLRRIGSRPSFHTPTRLTETFAWTTPLYAKVKSGIVAFDADTTVCPLTAYTRYSQAQRPTVQNIGNDKTKRSENCYGELKVWMINYGLQHLIPGFTCKQIYVFLKSSNLSFGSPPWM
jgi:hypothetical protein